MIRENEVREKIADAIRNRISVSDFSRWIMANSWNMHQDSSPSATALVSHIHALLSERSDLLIDDSEFLNELLVLINHPVLSTPVDIDDRAIRASRFVSSERWQSVAVPLVSA